MAPSQSTVTVPSAAVVAGTLILLYDWRLVDPIVTLMIAAYILWQSFAEIGPVIRILMNGSPVDVTGTDVVARMRAVEGVRDPDYYEDAASAAMRKDEIVIRADIGLGGGQATVWTCDLTKEYVAINGDYRS